MIYNALVSFAGVDVAMYEGETRDLKKSLAAPYVDCGFLREEKTTKKAVKSNDSKPVNKE